jgi:DUF1009 family protein
LRLGATAQAIKALKQRAIQDIVMIGAIRRPSLRELRPDFKTLQFFTMNSTKFLGDDGLLRALKSFLNKEGLVVRGIHEFMPELLAKEGVLGSVSPSTQDHEDIARGVEVLKALGPLDVGQSVIVQQGFVLGIEGAEGTDELIKRCAALKRKGAGAILVKLAKPVQDMDMDMPAIGFKTIENMIQGGFKGCAIQADATILSEPEKTIAIADRHKLFIMGIRI